MRSRLKWLLIAPVVLFALWAGYRAYVLDLGRRSFVRLGCASCHFAGGGPNLANILPNYDEPTVEDFIRDPEAVYRRLGRKPLNPGFAIMHRVKTTPREVSDMAHYLKSWQ